MKIKRKTWGFILLGLGILQFVMRYDRILSLFNGTNSLTTRSFFDVGAPLASIIIGILIAFTDIGLKK